MRQVLVVFVFVILWLPTEANARCVWEWDCATGQCQQVPVCDNVLDLPPVRPPEVPPIPPPSIKPLDPLVVPPPGTQACRQVYLCNGFGQCQWEVVCR
jgi:hypothetical protein